ncbi:MAG: ankyrin repeat domain-containing protein [Alphaproteobacteria bacterium]
MKNIASHIGASLKDAFYAAVYAVCTRKHLGEKLKSLVVVQDDWEIDEQMPRIRRILKSHPDWKNDKNAHFALSCAARHGANEVVKKLLDAGVDPDHTDDENRTQLTVSAICGDFEVAVMLLDKGACVDHVDKYGKTPLMYAAANHPEVAKLLLSRGASLQKVDRKGKSAVDHATAEENLYLGEAHEKCRALIVGAKEKEDKETREHEAYLSDGLPATRPIAILRPLSLIRR